MKYEQLIEQYKKFYKLKLNFNKNRWLTQATNPNYCRLTRKNCIYFDRLINKLFAVEYEFCKINQWRRFLDEKRFIELKLIKKVFPYKLAKLFFPLHFNPNFLDDSEV